MPHDDYPERLVDHSFGQDRPKAGERRTVLVVAITVTTMVVEIVAGIAFGSMALLADGLHMASHSVALLLTLMAYVYARRHAHDPRFSFGTGKVNALSGFAGALLLGGFAVVMVVESVERLLNPVDIAYTAAIVVAVVGLVVNAVSAVVLGGHGHDDHDHHHHDHNLRSAYLHVIADALTSVLAIVALLVARFFGAVWLDPVMGVVGAALVTHWSIGLLRQTARVLVDRQCPPEREHAIREALEDGDGTRVTDVHVWSIGPGIFAAEIVIHSPEPAPPEAYKRRLPDDLDLVHVLVEVNPVSRAD